MVYVSPLSKTEALIRNVPFGPWIVPDKLFNEPSSTTPLKSIRIPDISVDTEALPPITNVDGSILKAASVSICALILP